MEQKAKAQVDSKLEKESSALDEISEFEIAEEYSDDEVAVNIKENQADYYAESLKSSEVEVQEVIPEFEPTTLDVDLSKNGNYFSLSVKSNLPEGTKFVAYFSNKTKGVIESDTINLDLNREFHIDDFIYADNNLNGSFLLSIMVDYIELQPDNIKKMFGEQNKNLKGDYVISYLGSRGIGDSFLLEMTNGQLTSFTEMETFKAYHYVAKTHSYYGITNYDKIDEDALEFYNDYNKLYRELLSISKTYKFKQHGFSKKYNGYWGWIKGVDMADRRHSSWTESTYRLKFSELKALGYKLEANQGKTTSSISRDKSRIESRLKKILEN